MLARQKLAAANAVGWLRAMEDQQVQRIRFLSAARVTWQHFLAFCHILPDIVRHQRGSSGVSKPQSVAVGQSLESLFSCFATASMQVMLVPAFAVLSVSKEFFQRCSKLVLG